MKTSIFFYKELTRAEVGKTGTHEVYIRFPNDFDYKSFFHNSDVENGSVIEVVFDAEDASNKDIDAALKLRFVYFVNSNKEKRVPSLRALFDSHNVEEEDIVCLESRNTDGVISYHISFYKKGEIVISPNCICYSTVERENLSKPLLQASNLPLQQIFYGAPGTGKSHTIKKTTDGVDSKFVVRTTFHPDSDYSTFVGAYKPKMEVMPRYNPQTGEQMGVEKRIVYAYTPQAFLKAYTTAWKTPEQAVYLIIEEINRGNCAQIFGDLFQLLDRGDNGQSCYPIKADQDMQMHLMEAFADCPSLPENIQSGEELVLPSNLNVWATMNTSDQSLFPIDSAFKRRWEWKYIPITQGKDEGKLLQWNIEAEGVKYDWWSFLEVMNKRIGDTTSSEDKKLGFFFCKADEQGIISADKFVGKVLFYLWNDVFKDYPDNPIAMHLKEEGSEFTYGDFYTANAQGDVVVREELVTRLLDALGVTKVNPINADEAYDERADISTSEQERKDTLSSVSINGKQFTEQEYTQFDLYMNVLREIGIDRAGASIESMKFIRKGSKMATQNPLTQLADGYTYVKEGEYYFIKGANPYTLIRILEELKKILHLDMVIAYR